jgi:hypothetical protein
VLLEFCVKIDLDLAEKNQAAVTFILIFIGAPPWKDRICWKEKEFS